MVAVKQLSDSKRVRETKQFPYISFGRSKTIALISCIHTRKYRDISKRLAQS